MWGLPKLPVSQVSTSTRSPATASRQTKFNHRQRPSGNRLESPAYQALVKLSGPSARVGHDSCSYPGLACPQNLPVSASSGRNLGEPNPSVSASGQSGHLVSASPTVPPSYRRWFDQWGHGNLTAVGRCVACPGQARPGRRHGDAMDEAIAAQIYNASRLPPAF